MVNNFCSGLGTDKTLLTFGKGMGTMSDTFHSVHHPVGYYRHAGILPAALKLAK